MTSNRTISRTSVVKATQKRPRPQRQKAIMRPLKSVRRIEDTRPAYWNRLRARVDRWYASFPLPRINPDLVSLVAIFVAFLFVVAVSIQLLFVAWIFLVIHLFLDGLDGAIARKYLYRKTRIQQQHGQLVDIIADRASEGVLFVIPPFFLPWFPLFLLNTVLAIVAVRQQRMLIVPLRLLFFIVFTIQLLL
ncbi:MAG: CDP-alcohol phosphatidyltransferase family protein [bacterium]